MLHHQEGGIIMAKWQCKFSDHEEAVAAIGWNRFIPLCRKHAEKVLKLFPDSPTFRWL